MLCLAVPALGFAQALRVFVAPADAAPFGQLAGKLTPRLQQIAADTFFIPAAPSGLDSAAHTLLGHLRANAYLAASLDSLTYLNDSLATARLYLGPPMRWVRLEAAANGNQRWLEASGFREKLFTDKPLRYDVLLRLEQQLLQQAENTGYPFASVRLDSVQVLGDGGVSAQILVDPGRFFTFTDLKIAGNLRLPKSYLPQYLGLHPGSPYSHARVLRIRQRLNTLLFVETLANPTVTFAGNEARVNLFLQKKRASRFDFIIGLLPRSGASATDGRLLLTGSLSAGLLNAFNLGEHLSLELERLRPETQKLDVQAGIPYLFGLPFGLEGRLGIFRRDSTWVDAQSELGVQYLLEGGNFIQFFWENKSSSLQKIDTLAIIQSRRLPTVLDLRQNGFGLEATLNQLDYRFNPRKGWFLNLRAVAGFNSVLRNSTIEALRDPADPEFQFSSLYDAVAGRVARYRLEAQADYFIPLFVRSTLKLSMRGGGIFSEKPIYANEQYRLGGSKRLRGFDEESLFATRFAIATLEYRLLLSQNAFLSAFSDYGYLENLTDRNRFFLRPWGLGAGLNLETQAGIFGISLAVGRRDAGMAVDWRAPKFHLGYVNLF
ncbi:MAG: BamA/TamA family outer membrane protein [Lewinellaceae bacterium]|nr:BamA/TamA family outer membrane protein [Lewinellaceae bacterium]